MGGLLAAAPILLQTRLEKGVLHVLVLVQAGGRGSKKLAWDHLLIPFTRWQAKLFFSHARLFVARICKMAGPRVLANVTMVLLVRRLEKICARDYRWLGRWVIEHKALLATLSLPNGLSCRRCLIKQHY